MDYVYLAKGELLGRRVKVSETEKERCFKQKIHCTEIIGIFKNPEDAKRACENYVDNDHTIMIDKVNGKYDWIDICYEGTKKPNGYHGQGYLTTKNARRRRVDIYITPEKIQ